MLKRLVFVTLCLINSITFAQTSPDQPIVGFEAAEHIACGDQVKLRFDEHSEGSAGIKLQLPNGLFLTYGEIVSLAGDFYGLVDLPIVYGKTEKDRQQRFLGAYATLAKNNKAVSEVPKIREVMEDEQKQLQEGMERGERPSDIYARMTTDHNVAWNCITGGMCLEDDPNMTPEILRKIYYLKQGRYLKLADRDFDHFGDSAWLAYKTGHQLALEKAIEASHDKSKKLLQEAYAINAFACHYLSDGFSAGHMRTPRGYLYDKVTPATVGSLLSSYMHKEENELGLVVSNKRGDTWKAYGDCYYYEVLNQRNREILQEAMQLSADEVFTAYQTGLIPAEDKVFDLVPDLQKLLATPDDHLNPSPLFYWDAKHKSLKRRVSLNDPNSYSWTSYWLGWASLLELLHARGMPVAAQAELLAHTDSRNEALKNQAVTDKDVLNQFSHYH